MNQRASRTYGGQSHEARVAERRQRLMEAAARLYGREGAAGASVTAICAESGLTPRYFYESFANREALLLAVFELTCERLGRQPDEMIFLDDAPGHVAAAREMGIHAIVFQDNAQAIAEIEACLQADIT